MQDPFLWSIASVVVTATLLLIGLAALFDLHRKKQQLRQWKKQLPLAVQYPALQEEVEQLQASRQQLLNEAEEVKSILYRRKSAEQWLQANEVIYEKAQRELPALKAQIELAENERDTYYAQREQAEIECDGIRKEAAELQRSIAPLREAFERHKEVREWLDTHEPRFRQMQSEEGPLEEKVQNLRDQLTELGTQQTAVIAAGQQAAAERDWLLFENKRLNDVVGQQNAELRKLGEEIGRLQARKSALLEEVELLASRKTTLESDLSGIQGELTQATVKRKRLEDELRELDIDRAGRLAALKTLDQLTKGLQEEKARLEDQIEQTKRRLESELEQINQLIQAAAQRWDQVASTVGATDENRLQELWTPSLSKRQFEKPSHAAETESLENTASYLRGLGLRFHRRVLNAFHTSLKVNESSPLVVLAGISGTGKSELPRRYAEGMGMYSLTLPVQPRWDSPQDMFGFYNYLENRYRATELARALVQMDQFCDEPGRGWNVPDGWLEYSLRDRMLLVLLDEMNLARVEYYFSEFLSRLETRRGVNRKNPLDRRKAEILLEIGMQRERASGGTQQPTLPLFVDTNVLFVGTMNEDESTQTLSDKVVDRANVLRFGRPSRLDNPLTRNEVRPQTEWLGFATWKTWVRDETALSPEVRDQVTTWGQQLNEAYQAIGRPFAHRTFAAMLAYVANYPDPEQYRLAMADQIEQKLLPKLRGLDPQDHTVRHTLGKVQDVLRQLGDEELLNAVIQMSQQSEHQFLWNGVDRLEQA